MSNISRKRLLVLTSGGDAPGMNPALRSLVRCWLAQGSEHEYEVLAVRDGYNGLARGDVFEELSREDVAGLMHRGGTEIGAGRCDELKDSDSDARRSVTKVMGGLGPAPSGVVVIGGNGSFTGMRDVLVKLCKARAVGIPATIDNDLWGTDLSLGVDTAFNTAVEIIDKIRDTAAAFRRAFVVEVMGRGCGYLALATAIATESEIVFLPEKTADLRELESVLGNIDTLYEDKARETVTIVAEGAKLKTRTVQNTVEAFTNWEARAVVIGHTQRGGRPSALDRILGCRFGWKAVEALKDEQRGSGRRCAVTTLAGTDIKIRKDIDEILRRSGEGARLEDPTFKELLTVQRELAMCRKPLPYVQSVGGVLLVIHGADAPGINAAIRAFTRMAMKLPSDNVGASVAERTWRFRTIAIRGGFSGLANGPMENFVELDYHATAGFSYSGGTPAHLARRHIDPIRTSPRGWPKEEQESIKTQVNKMRAKVSEWEDTLAHKGKECQIKAVVVIGGRDAIRCIRDLRKAGFPWPFIYIPASIDNDIFLTDYSIGFDTALNNAVRAIDNIKDTALAEGRVFLIETMGGLSGFLPLSVGIASGAEHIFIPECFETPGPRIEDITQIAETIGDRFRPNPPNPPKTHAILIFQEYIVTKLGGIDRVKKEFEKVGSKSAARFGVRRSILGHTQRGGTPSAFDRLLASRLGAAAARALPEVVNDRHGGRAVLLKNDKIETLPISEFVEKVGTDVEAKETQMRELARIHSMLAADTWMAERWQRLKAMSDKIVEYDHTVDTIEMWERFWQKRPQWSRRSAAGRTQPHGRAKSQRHGTSRKAPARRERGRRRKE